MSDAYLIRHCAPTLAGLKTGNLFSCNYQSRQTLMASIREWNRRLSPKGIQVLPLRLSEKKALIYVYRPIFLSRDLSQSAAEAILQCQGYATGNCIRCVAELIRRVQCQEAFPHEIGLFLGYPPEDVRGFMENNAAKWKCAGCWKVYGDPEAARKTFRLYRKCSQVYWDQWIRGKDIERLAVASKAG